jgi:hypothetical protein
MSDKYMVITTITHTRNTYVVNLADIVDVDINLMTDTDLDVTDFIDTGDSVYSSLISEDVIAFAIKDYITVIEHLETTEGTEAAIYFEELEDDD